MAILFILFAFLAQTILFLTHWFLYKTAVRFIFAASPAALPALKIFLGVMSLTFVAASLLSSRYSALPARFFYIVAVFWLGLLLYFSLAAAFCWLAYGLTQWFSFTLNLKLFAVASFTLALGVGIYGTINANFIRTTNLTLKIPNLPQLWQNKTAVWISDLHLGEVRNKNFAKMIAARVKGLNPDVVFIGGDLYDGEAVDLDKVTEPFSQINSAFGTYFITGNHEEFSDANKQRYLETVARYGLRILENEMVILDGLQIIGVDYSDSSSQQNFENILKNVKINPNQPSILLKHAPTNIPAAKEAGISLQLSGHAHAGQIFPVGLISHLVYKGYEYGLKQEENFFIYTSSGAGTWGPPMRVGAAPEIVLIKFEN